MAGPAGCMALLPGAGQACPQRSGAACLSLHAGRDQLAGGCVLGPGRQLDSHQSPCTPLVRVGCTASQRNMHLCSCLHAAATVASSGRGGCCGRLPLPCCRVVAGLIVQPQHGHELVHGVGGVLAALLVGHVGRAGADRCSSSTGCMGGGGGSCCSWACSPARHAGPGARSRGAHAGHTRPRTCHLMQHVLPLLDLCLALVGRCIAAAMERGVLVGLGCC